MAKDEDYVQLLEELHAYRLRLSAAIESLKETGELPCCVKCENLWVARPEFLRRPVDN